MKNTTNPHYVGESVYRCFGYLYDFQDAALFDSAAIACILLVNGVVGPGPAVHGQLIVMTSSMRDTLVSSLRASLLAGR